MPVPSCRQWVFFRVSASNTHAMANKHFPTSFLQILPKENFVSFKKYLNFTICHQMPTDEYLAVVWSVDDPSSCASPTQGELVEGKRPDQIRGLQNSAFFLLLCLSFPSFPLTFDPFTTPSTLFGLLYPLGA